MFRLAVGPFLPQHAQDLDSPRGAIGPPVIRGRAHWPRGRLFTADDWRRWQRR